MEAAGVRPNTITYSSLISACAKGGQWRAARDAFDTMRTQCVAPDTITYNALITAYASSGLWEEAEQVNVS
jgi:pentatricopeptide repeat domain-containing protein 1